MPRGDKLAYTDKQKRQAEHIEVGYESRGIPEDEAERRAWATVNKETGGGRKNGSGRGKPENHAPSRKGGKLGGKAAAARPAAARSASAKKGGGHAQKESPHSRAEALRWRGIAACLGCRDNPMTIADSVSTLPSSQGERPRDQFLYQRQHRPVRERISMRLRISVRPRSGTPLKIRA
jgi:hypothetical protein